MSRLNRHLKLSQSGTAGERGPGSHPRPRRSPRPRHVPDALATLACWMTLVIHPGCVALNLPSERYHDPDDLGGLLGPMKQAGGPMPPSDRVEETYGLDESHRDNGLAWPEFAPNRDGEAVHDQLVGDPFACHPFACHPFACDVFACDAGEDVGGEKEDPVPWPKYHPVPTRPVFGGTAPFGAAP